MPKPPVNSYSIPSQDDLIAHRVSLHKTNACLTFTPPYPQPVRNAEATFIHCRWRQCWLCVVHCSCSCHWQAVRTDPRANNKLATTDNRRDQARIGHWCVPMVCQTVSVAPVNQPCVCWCFLWSWRGVVNNSWSPSPVTVFSTACADSLLHTVIACIGNDLRVLARFHSRVALVCRSYKWKARSRAFYSVATLNCACSLFLRELLLFRWRFFIEPVTCVINLY